MVLGDIIAERDLKTTDGRSLKILMGAPRQFDDGGGWWCPYQIVGAGDENVRIAGGVDGIQAVQLAMRKIGADIWLINEDLGGTLRWEGETDLGFPSPH